MSGSELEKLINSFVDKDELTEKDILNKPIRFSITLPNVTSKRLDVLCRRLNMAKQQFIASIIEASLIDLEEKMGLISGIKKSPFNDDDYREYNPEYEKEIMRELGIAHFISSLDEIEEEGE